MIAHRLLATAVAGLCLTPASPTSDAALRERVEAVIKASGAEVAVAMRTLDGGRELMIRAADSFHAASTMKVPVMIELFRQAQAGTLSLDQRIPVVNRFHSIVDGSPYSLSAGDDSEAGLYKADGESRSYRELCELMITRSSNLATNVLIERLGVEKVRATVSALGADGMQVKRGVEDNLAFRAGQNNTTTAAALLTLLGAIGSGKAVSPDASRQMVEILQRQEFNEGIPAGVPAGTRVAHKTGSITRIQHDAAIVFAPRPYVLVVLVRGLDDEKRSQALIADISRAVYASLENGKAKG
jgi:beta-lactamase class A